MEGWPEYQVALALLLSFLPDIHGWVACRVPCEVSCVMILTIVAVALAVVFVLGVLGLGATALLQVIRRTERELGAPNEEVEVRLASLEVTVAGLPSLWEEERKRAKRAQDSARKDREHAEAIREQVSEAIEGSEELRDDDVQGEPELGVHDMRANMGVPAATGLADRAAAVAHLLR